jgi:hypothetical protein
LIVELEKKKKREDDKTWKGRREAVTCEDNCDNT